MNQTCSHRNTQSQSSIVASFNDMDHHLPSEANISTPNNPKSPTNPNKPFKIRYPPQAPRQIGQPEYMLFQPEQRKILQPVSIARGGRAALIAASVAAAPRAPSEPSHIGERSGQRSGAGVASGGEGELSDEQLWSHARPKKMPVSVKKRLRETDIERAKEAVASTNTADMEAQSRAHEDLNQGKGSEDPDPDGGVLLPVESEDEDSDGGVPLPVESEDLDSDSDESVSLPEESEDSVSDSDIALSEGSEDFDSDSNVALSEWSGYSDSDGGVLLPEESEDEDENGDVASPEESEDGDQEGGVTLPAGYVFGRG